ncbi:DUF6531 domain-containing protein [Actinophytocola xanthii]|nr:DUF6531 domain-containing protein [Actinophytocola xanthii]
MSEGNPLVAQSQDTTTAVTGIGIAESAQGLAQGVSDGDWVEAGLSAVGVGLEVLSLVIDPLGTLASYGVSWLIEHVRPLKEALDWFAGDPPVIQSFSQTWANVAAEVAAVSQDYLREARSGTAGWSGQAGEAYRTHATESADALAGAGVLADGISAGVMIMGEVVAFVREFIRDLVADLVGRLIAWALEAAATLGLATPVIVAQATAAISKTVAKVADVVRKLVKTIGNVGPRIRKILDKLDEIIAKLAKLRKADAPGGTSPSAARGGSSPDAPTTRGSDGTSPSSTSDADAAGGTTPSGAAGGRPGGGKPGGGDSPGMRDNAGNPKTDARDTECTPGSGEPIDLATGQMYLEQFDVDLKGTLPLLLQRTHYSSYRVGRFFGRSWSSTLDQRIEVDDQGVYFADADGARLVYPVPPADGTAVFAEFGARWALRRTPEGYTVEQPERGRTLSFAGPGELLPLTRLADRNGNEITFSYDDQGAVTGIRHSGGYDIGVDTEDMLVRRLWLRGAQPVTLMRYRYDERRRLVEVVNSSDKAHRFTYDDSGRIVRWEDRNGEWYEYEYDQWGRCVRTNGSGGAMACSWVYDTGSTVFTDSRGTARTYYFNDLLQVVREVGPGGEETRREWDRYDRLASQTDPLGRTTRYERDAAGNLVRIVRPDGSHATAEYNELGLPVRIVDPDGAVWLQTYDTRGNLVQATDPLGATTVYQIDDRGRPVTITDAEGGIQRLEHDAAGLIVAVTDAVGAITRYRRDQFGRVVEITGATDATERFTWTVEGLMMSHTQADGATERWFYDGESSLVRHVDVLGNVTTIETTHFDFPRSEVGPDGSRLDFAYDTEMNLVAVTNARGEVWRYGYDAVGRLVEETDFGGRTRRYELNAAGEVIATVNGAGTRIELVRDVLGNIVERRSEGATIASYEFDPLGRITAARNADATVVFERDRLGRVVAETVNGRTVRSAYDLLGRRVSRVTPTGSTMTWSFDAEARPATLRTAGRVMSFGHDARGREVERSMNTGTALTQAWDVCDRLVSQAVAGGPAARVVQRRAYRYRVDGDLIAIQDQLDGTRRFELDPVGRITAVDGPTGNERYAYDRVGEIAAAAWQGGTAEAQGPREYAGSRLVRAGNVRYQYDAQGRVVMRQRKRLSTKPDIWRYSWDVEDRLVGVVTPDGTSWRYRYDALGRRIAKQRLAPDGRAAERTDFTWAGEHLVEQAHSGGRATTWVHHPRTGAVLTQTERVIARDAPQRWVDERFYSIVTDLVGTPTELVDDAGELVWRRQTTVWGQALEGLRQRAYTPLRFPGQYHDQETGLDYNHHRYYDAEVGRYYSGDPLGLLPAPNPDAYVPNPLTWSDPLGLAASQARRGPCRCGEIRPDGRRVGIDPSHDEHWVSPDAYASAAAREHRNAARTEEGATSTGQHGAGYRAAARGLREEARNRDLLPEVREALLRIAKRYEARARGIDHNM